MNDYERIARVIRFLDARHDEQPSLATLAEQAKLSEFHFHRLFSSWAGISPKDFLQCLTLAHAKELLAAGRSVLETALEAGLSGPGRLHDLCVTLEGASPGELKGEGARWEIVAGFAESPFGTCLIGESPRGICHLSFQEPGSEEVAWLELAHTWPLATLVRNDKLTQQRAAEIFAVDQVDAPKRLRAFVKGTPFQVSVWRALLAIPPGTITSYGTIAVAIGHPAAVRAVGTAVGRNEIAYLIPCHRVIRETGVIGGYRWGPVRKRAILAWETARQVQTPRAEATSVRRSRSLSR